MNNIEEILRQRAVKAAKPLETMHNEDEIEAVYFKIENEVYAIEAEVVREVHKFKEPTPVPFTPSYIYGIFHMRGKFISLVNLRSFLGIDEQGEENATLSILLLSNDIMEFGVAINEVLEQKRVPRREIQALTSSFDFPRKDLIVGVMEDGVVILDGKKILADSAIIVHK